MAVKGAQCIRLDERPCRAQAQPGRRGAGARAPVAEVTLNLVPVCGAARRGMATHASACPRSRTWGTALTAAGARRRGSAMLSGQAGRNRPPWFAGQVGARAGTHLHAPEEPNSSTHRHPVPQFRHQTRGRLWPLR